MSFLLRLVFAGLSASLLPGLRAAPAPEPPPLRIRSQVIDSSLRIGYGLAIADVDGDRRDDILLADAREIAWYRNPGWKKHVIARELTPKDHVCIAARDIDGDGRAEIAVGAEWNPGDTETSGAIFYLDRPDDPTGPWRPVRLPHEPTTHRMHWIEASPGQWLLAVLPLHGKGNRNGEGVGLRFLGYQRPARVDDPWPVVELNASFHLAHNFDLSPARGALVYVAEKQGISSVAPGRGPWITRRLTTQAAGEVRVGRAPNQADFLTAIEPMHGNQLTVYSQPGGGDALRVLLDENLIQAHGLATGDLLGLGYDQIVVGWRGAMPGQRVGILLFVAENAEGTRWKRHAVIDDNTVACEDLKLADLDGDGRLDVIACGRATRNLVVYWNETPHR